jgi:predicted ABC-type ATPase
MSKLLFLIIAGPNGAGKSTASKAMLKAYGVEAFDWDFEFYKLWKKFGFDPAVENGVKDRTTELFNEHLNEALKDGRSVAYETNFHIDYHFEREQLAKEKGFDTVLYFFFVEHTDICDKRVKLRHGLGGHFVDKKTVAHRWKEGLKRLNIAIETFDQVLIFDTSNDYEINSLAIVLNHELISWVPDDISELQKHLPALHKMIP